MPARFLLDTNVLSDLIRYPKGVAARNIAETGEAAVCTSIIVACELRYGAVKKNSTVLTDRIEALLESIEVMPFEQAADRHYAAIRSQLTREGRLIGPNDLLIAAHARSLDLTLVTANIEEFSRVPGLHVENWLI